MSIIVLNSGQETNFNITASTVSVGNQSDNFYKYNLYPETVFVDSNSTAEIRVEIIVYDNATNGLSVTFSIIAQSTYYEQDNNFITFELTTTTADPPEFTESVSTSLQISKACNFTLVS